MLVEVDVVLGMKKLKKALALIIVHPLCCVQFRAVECSVKECLALRPVVAIFSLTKKKQPPLVFFRKLSELFAELHCQTFK